MEKEVYFLLIIFVVIAINQYYYLKLNDLNTIHEANDLDEVKVIEYLSHRFAEYHEYINRTYNCVNYSQDYVTSMAAFGFEVVQQSGHNYTHGHAWVKVCLDLEPQTGEFVPEIRKKYPVSYRLE